MSAIAAQRQAVIAAAKTWLRTPFHHEGRVKGVGVDCAMFLAEVYREAGLCDRLAVEHYPPDWHLHRSRERYLAFLEGCTFPVEAPQPADIALFRVGRCYSHGAVVLAWPLVIHAKVRAGVVYDDIGNSEFAGRPVIFRSPWRPV